MYICLIQAMYTYMYMYVLYTCMCCFFSRCYFGKLLCVQYNCVCFLGSVS